ncbi:hypothetical protein H7I39_11430 [Mycobacterium doricum]|nr:hypothetical protein [Mycolicibacterium doricum]
MTQTTPTSILNNAPRWSHPTGNQVVPSPWQATLVEACEKWNEIFGNAFPVVTSDELSMEVGDRSHAKHPRTKDWVVDLRPDCSVRISVQKLRGRKGKFRDYRSGGPPIFASAQTTLRFRALTSGDSGASIWWRVTNTGAHARETGVKQLRGDFFRGKGPDCKSPGDNPSINHESAAYTGAHIIEAFMVRGGRVIAQSEPFRVNVFSRKFPVFRR